MTIGPIKDLNPIPEKYRRNEIWKRRSGL